MASQLTLKPMARRISSSSDPKEVARVLRKIQHWTNAGLFEVIESLQSVKYVGRGRARRYMPDAVYWGALFLVMAEQGASLNDMLTTVNTIIIKQKRWQRGGEPDLVEQALRGEGPTVFLIQTDPIIDPSYPDGPALEDWDITTDEIAFKSGWISGRFFNLTSIFERVRE